MCWLPQLGVWFQTRGQGKQSDLLYELCKICMKKRSNPQWWVACVQEAKRLNKVSLDTVQVLVFLPVPFITLRRDGGKKSQK